MPPSLGQVAVKFVYLINGKRVNLPGMNELGSPMRGIYIMPGNTLIGMGTGKSLHGSMK